MQLAQIEALAEKLYNPQTAQERQTAEQALSLPVATPEALSQCLYIVGHSGSSYALYFALSTMTKMVTQSWPVFTLAQAAAARNDVLAFLAGRGAAGGAERYVVRAAEHFVARVSKLCMHAEHSSSVRGGSGSTSATGAVGEGATEPEEAIVGLVGQHFFQDTAERRLVGLEVLDALVQEMGDQRSGALGMSAHAKVALRFREHGLLGAFVRAVDTLRAALDAATTVQPAGPAGAIGAAGMDGQTRAVVAAAVQLAYSCAAYNFLGTPQDETAESSASVQFPLTWRPLFEDGGLALLFFRTYAASVPPTSATALDTVAQLLSARRALFSSDGARAQFLRGVLASVQQLLEARSGLDAPENHHALCRLICRVKNNFQIQQLLAYDGWAAWIACVHRYTLSALAAWRWAPASVHYLMSFWVRVVSALTYASSSTDPGALPQYVPQLVEAYVRTRLDSVDAALQGALDTENPLANEDLLAEELAVLGTMGRFDYPRTRAVVAAVLDPGIAALRALRDDPAQRPPPAQHAALARLCGHLAWAVHIAAVLVRGRMATASSDDADAIDGELAARVFTLFQTTDAILARLADDAAGTSAGAGTGAQQQQLAQQQQQALAQQELRLCLEKDSFESYLELAYIAFCQAFRHMYICDASVSCSRAFSRLGELTGIGSHTAALTAIVGKVTTNLKLWRGNQAVVTKTLAFFQDVSGGYCSGRLLAKLDIIGTILAYHADSVYAFPLTRDGLKQCTLFYTSLGKMLSTDEHSDKFAAFAQPIEDAIRGLLAQPGAAALQAQPACKQAAARTLAQLLGLFASASAAFYTTLFEWLHPQLSPVIPRLAEAYADTEPLLAKLVMKLVGEMCNNRAARIRFDTSSPNGILLFKDICSPTVVTYARRLVNHLAQQQQQQQQQQQLATARSSSSAAGVITPDTGLALGGGRRGTEEEEREEEEARQKREYAAHYRGVALCLDPLTNCLCGEFLNFGVFALYGDACFEAALQSALQVVFTVAPDEVVRFPKLAKSCFGFFDALSRSQPAVLCALDSALFAKVAAFVLAGLPALDASTSSCCCSILTNVFAFYLRARARPAGSPARAAAAVFEASLAAHPQLFPRVFDTLVGIVLFSDCQYLYTLSRPLQQMCTIAPQQLAATKARFAAAQPSAALRTQLLAAFDALEADIGAPGSTALVRSTSPALVQKSKDTFAQSVVAFAAAVKPFISACVPPPPLQ